VKGVSTWIWILGGIVITFIIFSLFLKILADMTIEKHRHETMESFEIMVMEINYFYEKFGVEKKSIEVHFSEFMKNIYASEDGEYHTDPEGISEGNYLCINFNDNIECRNLIGKIWFKFPLEQAKLISLLDEISGNINYKIYRMILKKEEDLIKIEIEPIS
jgi:hypothetical protein